MAKWGFWEWVAYAVLFVAAIIIATDQGIKLSPDLASLFNGVLTSPYWGFAPLVLLLLATGILVGRDLEWIGKRSVRIGDYPKWPDPYQPTFVVGKTYRNQEVMLDGYSYVNCSFYNVTFVYNGATPMAFTGNHIFGNFRVRSDNPAVDGSFILARGLGLLPDNFELNLGASNVKIEPLKRVP